MTNEPMRFTRTYRIIVDGHVTAVTEKEFERVQALTKRAVDAQDRLADYLAHLQSRKLRRRKGEER
jgi:hypothetical protein